MLLEISQYNVPAQNAHDDTAKMVVTATPRDTPAVISPPFVIMANTMSGLSVCTKINVMPAASVSKKIHVPLDEWLTPRNMAEPTKVRPTRATAAMTCGLRSVEDAINTRGQIRRNARIRAGNNAYHEFETTADVACAPSAMAKPMAAKSAKMASWVKKTLPKRRASTRPSMSTSCASSSSISLHGRMSRRLGRLLVQRIAKIPPKTLVKPPKTTNTNAAPPAAPRQTAHNSRNAALVPAVLAAIPMPVDDPRPDIDIIDGNT